MADYTRRVIQCWSGAGSSGSSCHFKQNKDLARLGRKELIRNGEFILSRISIFVSNESRSLATVIWLMWHNGDNVIIQGPDKGLWARTESYRLDRPKSRLEKWPPPLSTFPSNRPSNRSRSAAKNGHFYHLTPSRRFTAIMLERTFSSNNAFSRSVDHYKMFIDRIDNITDHNRIELSKNWVLLSTRTLFANGTFARWWRKRIF